MDWRIGMNSWMDGWLVGVRRMDEQGASSENGDLLADRSALQQLPQIPIKNFRRVNEWMFRGAQPSMESFASLTQLEIKTVINLRWQPGPVARERKRVEGLGMKFEHVSLNYWTLPTQKDVDAFLRLVDDEEKRPIFVHCLHGKDRTGIMIAMFRILRCGWTLRQAYDEMVKCGFHRVATRHFKWALWRLAGRNTRHHK